jgi:OFA family oxalate/formate antiporter-like MFS transporter
LLNQPIAAIVCLGVIGFCYGALIAVYPYTVALAFGPRLSAQAYGRVFTAWGAAGLAAPWLAGYLYDSSGNYYAALLVAAGIGLISAFTALWLPRLNDRGLQTS